MSEPKVLGIDKLPAGLQQLAIDVVTKHGNVDSLSYTDNDDGTFTPISFAKSACTNRPLFFSHFACSASLVDGVYKPGPLTFVFVQNEQDTFDAKRKDTILPDGISFRVNEAGDFVHHEKTTGQKIKAGSAQEALALLRLDGTT